MRTTPFFYSMFLVFFASAMAFANQPTIVISNQAPVNTITANSSAVPATKAIVIGNTSSTQVPAVPPSVIQKIEPTASADQVFQDLFSPLEVVMENPPTLSFSSDHRAIIVSHFDSDQKDLCAIYNQAYGQVSSKPTLVVDRKIIACSS